MAVSPAAGLALGKFLVRRQGQRKRDERRVCNRLSLSTVRLAARTRVFDASHK